MACGRSQPSREVRETHVRGLCLGWHPSNLSGGGRSGCLRTQDSWIVSTSEEDIEGPLLKLRSWTNKWGMMKNPAVFVLSRQGAVAEAPEIESKLKVIWSSTPSISESANGSKRPRRLRGPLRKRPLFNDAGTTASQCLIQEL